MIGLTNLKSLYLQGFWFPVSSGINREFGENPKLFPQL